MKFSSNLMIGLAFLLGIAAAFIPISGIEQSAHLIAQMFIKALKLISLPVLFLSIVATFSGMSGMKSMRFLGFKVFKYTLLTTILAAFTALILFFIVQPARQFFPAEGVAEKASYIGTVLSLFPENFFSPFIESNAMGIVVIAFALGSAVLMLPEDKKKPLHTFFDSLFHALLTVAKGIIFLLPIGIWAFSTEFTLTVLREGVGTMKSIFLYVIVIVSANLIQGFIVLPTMLKLKGISPLLLFKSVSKALAVAFFSKSSNATLPLTLKAMREEVKTDEKVSSFSLPLCSTINMNGCAAFILVTIMFVATSYGWTFTFLDGLIWMLIATALAIGNAGVPMGCYFLSSMLLASMGLPIELLGIILPVYAVIDMIETALNVWSDCCVTAVVDKEIKSLGKEAVIQ